MSASASAACSTTRARGAVATSAAVFLALAVLFSALGYLSYQSQTTQVEQQYTAALSKETGLRKKAIENWLEERWADALVLETAPTVGHVLDGVERAPEQLAETLGYLEDVRSNYRYSGISIMRSNGHELARAGSTFPDAAAVRAAAASIAATPQRLMLGPRPLEPGSPPLIAFMLPVYALHGGDRISDKVVVLYVDPRHRLYRTLQVQPAGSWEALLVRAAGDSVEFISPRRFDPHGKLPNRLPIDQAQLPAALATSGISGVHAGIDYRGVPVLYSAAPIAGTDWYVLEKIDRAEALAPLRRSATAITAWTFLLIALAGFATFWFERRRDLAQKLLSQKAALERAALEEHFRHLARYANDATFLYDATGRIIEANERATQMYGYGTAELRGIKGDALRAPDLRAEFEVGMQRVRAEGTATFETVDQRKDGSILPVEISARSFEVDGQRYFHSVVRDISERKSAEARIRTLNRLYQTLWQTNEVLVRADSRDYVLHEICRIAVDEGNLVGAWVGMLDASSANVVVAAASAGLENYLANARITVDPDDPRGRGPIGTAIREARAVVVEDFMHDPTTAPWRARALPLHISTSAAFPLRVGDRIVGTLSYYAASTGYFNAEIVQLFDQTARDVGYALGRFEEDERRREAERQLADSEEQFKQAFESASIGIILIATDGCVLKANASSSTISGYSAAELVGTQFQRYLAAESVGPLMMLFGEMLSGERDLVRTEARIVRKDGQPVWIRVNAARITDGLGKLRHLVVQVEDISEFKEGGERVRRYMEELEETMMGTVRAVSTMVEIRDPYTAGHELRVGKLSAAIADEMGLDADRCRGLDIAGSLHDIGKISVPAEILSKPTRLQPAEFEIVKTHAQSGHDILKDIHFPWPIAEVALQHHERLDGSGYPQGLKGEQIILEARILAVADVVESMGSHRPYRPARGLDAALEEIANGRGRLFDADAVDACLRLFRDKGYQLPA